MLEEKSSSRWTRPTTPNRQSHRSICAYFELGNALEHFKGIFDGHGQVPTKGLIATQRFALGAIFVYQLAFLYRFEHDLELCVGLKAFLKAA